MVLHDISKLVKVVAPLKMPSPNLAHSYICVSYYAERKMGCVPVAQPKNCHHNTGVCVTFSYQSVVAQEVARHRDTPNFCVCVISDIYP